MQKYANKLGKMTTEGTLAEGKEGNRPAVHTPEYVLEASAGVDSSSLRAASLVSVGFQTVISAILSSGGNSVIGAATYLASLGLNNKYFKDSSGLKNMTHVTSISVQVALLMTSVLDTPKEWVRDAYAKNPDTEAVSTVSHIIKEGQLSTEQVQSLCAFMRKFNSDITTTLTEGLDSTDVRAVLQEKIPKKCNEEV